MGAVAGVHALLFAEDAERARTFLRDVLELRGVDAGDGWLIFALPPAEIAVHPGGGSGGRHELYLMCRDIEAAIDELSGRGVEFTAPVSDEGWGLRTRLKVPGAGEIGLYEPRHPSALDGFG